MYEVYDPCGCENNNDLACSQENIELQKHTNIYQENPLEGSVHKDLCLPTRHTSQHYSSQLKRANHPGSTPSLNGKIKETLDPTWYGGELSRQEAELVLRRMDQDGAFLVRDSSKGQAEHPYTLMVLKQAKVYNIKIRKQGEKFILGTGLHNYKIFPGVTEIITYHSHTPLLLIDAMDHGSETQRSWCLLLHPVGLWQ